MGRGGVEDEGGGEVEAGFVGEDRAGGVLEQVGGFGVDYEDWGFRVSSARRE